MLWAAMYPAVGFLLLAARCAGLGSTLTMLQLLAENEIRELLGVPSSVDISALVVVGWPVDAFTPVKRRPVGEVLSWNQWT
jgi:nitroreductase